VLEFIAKFVEHTPSGKRDTLVSAGLMIPESDLTKPGTKEMCYSAIDELLRSARVAPTVQVPTPEYIELVRNGNVTSVVQVGDEFIVRVKL